MPISAPWLPLRDIRSSILQLSVLESHYNLCLSTLTDQLLFRPDNTFHYRHLDIGNKFEKNGNKTANNKRKRNAVAKSPTAGQGFKITK